MNFKDKNEYNNALSPVIKKTFFTNKFIIIILLFTCIAPIIASYLTYYYFKPTNKINHGILIDPQKPLPNLQLENLEANLSSIDSLNTLKGKWILLITSGANCNEQCAKLLYTIRQLRHSQGKEANRIVPVWLITDNNDIDPIIREAYNTNLAGVKFVKINQNSLAILQDWLNIANNKFSINKNIYMIDPNQNLMMLYNPTHTPQGMIKDISKLLKWSRIG